MLGFFSSVDEGQRNVTKEDVSFIHIFSSDEKDIDIECRPYALDFARHFNIDKVYLFYGEKGKIIYDCPL